MDDRYRIQTIISFLNTTYGHLSWWDAPFDEVAIGAILTQQTRWENVTLALWQLHAAGLATLSSIDAADPGEIEQCIRCTGFYRVKTSRLRRLAACILDNFGDRMRNKHLVDGRMTEEPIPDQSKDYLEQMSRIDTEELRRTLLMVNGVGEETADSILCYGLFRPVCIIDAYTQRICECAGIRSDQKQLRQLFLEELHHDNALLRSFHGQIVEYGKAYCGKKRCSECMITALNG
ncbi:MAG: Fe-S cluster assembly protein HesB [Methanocalculus sp. MSAO_Arc2]|uniref:endonuclease III domain-containing protein n=1 Tax=Methanocalculus sp. MSAO_Arc2 TaxID=2293855 RepID=UPI000FF03270|nr:MAG: Fe-S cluster assembly protein HesB [Methanocalculus sp. MSAO_Arc2]